MKVTTVNTEDVYEKDMFKGYSYNDDFFYIIGYDDKYIAIYSMKNIISIKFV